MIYYDLKTLVDPKRVAHGLYWQRAWSLVSGCTPCSPGCLRCWSARQTHVRAGQATGAMYARYGGLTEHIAKEKRIRFNGLIRLQWQDLDKPTPGQHPAVWSIWTDLFHEDVPDDFLRDTWRVMARCEQHFFLILTKRIERAHHMLTHKHLPYLPNVGIGVTVENAEHLDRMDTLCHIPAALRFVSFEPLLGDIDFECWWESYSTQVLVMKDGAIHWAIIGAETGPGARPCNTGWLLDLAMNCYGRDIPIFVKAIHENGRVSRRFDKRPEILQRRDFPIVVTA